MSDSIQTSDSIIRVMPPELSNKIAAGEVIQRPGSVIKELLDNAIDAGADQIKIVVQNAGRTLLQVIDNGCGMSKDDLRPCFQLHATSKIESIEDLYRIQTLGFRGEAMASIASIAQVEVRTKRHEDENAFLMEVWGGEEKRFEPVATDSGTSVSVRNLFYNIPARRQFLKTDATEFRHILRTIQHAALAHCNISFELVADTDVIYHLPAQPIEQRIAELFGKQYRASVIPFEEETSYVKIHGLVGDPKLAKKSRGEQFIFVNRRPVQHRYLVHIILNLFDMWTKQGEYPFFAVFLEIDPSKIDVNVHPAKEEVKFDDERSIVQLTRSVLKKALNSHFMVPDLDDSQYEPDHFGSFNTPVNFGGAQGDVQSGKPMQFSSRINSDFIQGRGDDFAQRLYSDENASASEQKASHDRRPDALAREFWQLHDRFILTQTRTGLCLIDQNAAHKRIIYEKALSATEEALPGTQQLLFAQTVEFSASDFALLKELLPVIQRMGFSIQLLSGNTAIINGVPADIDIGDEKSVMRDMLHEYQELNRKVKLDARHKIAISFASKTAIPRGRKLTALEMETIIDQLFACSEPYQDPLGKPTLTIVSLDEIYTRFR